MSTENPPANPYLAPIQLENCAFTDIRISAQSDAKPEVENIAINVNFGGGVVPGSKDQWQVVVRVNLSALSPEKKPTYTGTIECVGIFRVLAQFPPDKLEKVVVVNGTGMLYASIREMLLILTSRGPFPPVCLISQSFSAGFEQGKTKENQPKG